MKKKFFIFSLTFFFLFFFLFVGKNYSYAACADTTATCIGQGRPLFGNCPAGTTTSSGSCRIGATTGVCCTPNNSGTSGTGNSCTFNSTCTGGQTCNGVRYNNSTPPLPIPGSGTCGTLGTGGTGTVPPPNNTTTGCGTGAMEVWTLDCIFPLLQRLIDWALTFAGVVALILIIYSGIKFVTSGGDQKSVESAKKTLTYAIIGLVLILLSFFVINMIAYATKVSCISFMGFEACR